MTIFTLPGTPAIRRSRWGNTANNTVFRSPLDQAAQVLELPGAKWVASYVLPPMERANAAAWQSFLMKLRGRANQFYGYDPDARSPRGTGAGAPTVNGASQTGTSLVTDGWTASQTVLKVGDYFAYDITGGAGRQLHMVVADAVSDGTGQATLTFEPPIRTSPADNEPLILTDASCPMMLTDPSVGWDADQISLYGIEFEAEEAF